MLNAFKTHCQRYFPELYTHRCLLAISGGVDSMVLADLAHQLGWNVVWAHVNFQLRGEESDAETAFVTDRAKAYGVELHKVYFDTPTFALEKHLSIQVAARELRYQYFQEVQTKTHCDYLLTAHHADDNLETFFINLSRATGIDGLLGIPAKNEHIRRPLLSFSRESILNYASEQQLPWKEDSSNAKTVYARNYIRHEIAPKLQEWSPQFTQQLQATQQHLAATQRMAMDAAAIVFQNAVLVEGENWRIQLDKLKQLPNYADYLYHWLRGYGFQAWDDIVDLVEAQTGKQIYSGSHVLLKNRSEIILNPIKTVDNNPILIEKIEDFSQSPLKLTVNWVTDVTQSNSQSCIFVDYDKAPFPWHLRKSKIGDVFHPIGMNNQRKKVSKFFKDEKYAQHEKAEQWLITNAQDEIIWIIGKRADERFKPNNQSRKTLQLTVF